jgi:glycine cleavage system H protein
MESDVTRKDETRAALVLCFTEEHLWVRADRGRAQIGISDFGQDQLGEIIAVELPEVGETIERGSPFGEIESVRTVHELIGPVTGTVTAVNADLDDHPELLNEDPYHEGWLVEVSLEEESELDDLIPADEYEDSIASEEA